MCRPEAFKPVTYSFYLCVGEQECSYEEASEALQRDYLKGNKVVDLAEYST